jgi:hypothetical protein
VVLQKTGWNIESISLCPIDRRASGHLMIHGILSSPLMWRDLTNRIMGDPVLQRKYQVWHYTYATGLPILTSANMFREQLEGINIALQRAGLPPRDEISGLDS